MSKVDGEVMGEQVAISLQNVSKCYKRYIRPADRLKEILLPGRKHAQEFWALRDINLEVLAGETLGIIGRNGAGKSTLLQIIARTLTPTTGEVMVKGRLSALLELGSGFNPEFTGQQNVFFNGQILGLSREEVEAKFDDIAAFAEIGSFMHQPVKTYSSGMALRLAFAVVANIDPKILIVDEALAVGDAKFQARCMKRIRQLREQGATILFVSHDSSSIKMLCERAVLVEGGKIIEMGEPKEVVNHYIALLSSDIEISSDIENSAEAIALPEYGTGIADQPSPASTQADHHAAADGSDVQVYRHGNQLATLKGVKILDENHRETTKLETGSLLKIVVSVEANADLPDLVVGISIRNLIGLVIYGTNTLLVNNQVISLKKSQQLTVAFDVPCHLNKGIYTVTVGLHSEEGLSYDWIDELVVFEVNNKSFCDGIVDLRSNIEVA